MPPRDDPFGANQKSLPISHPKCDNFHLDTDFMNYNMKPTEETMIKTKSSTTDYIIPEIVTPEVEKDSSEVDTPSLRSTRFPSRNGTFGTSRPETTNGLKTITELLYEFKDVKRLVLPNAKTIQL